MNQKMSPEKILKLQTAELERTGALLGKAMPAEFFAWVSEEELAVIGSLAVDLEHKSGFQTVECDKGILAVYLKSSECHPGTAARLFAGQGIASVRVFESAPVNDRGDVIVVEAGEKVSVSEAAPRFALEQITEAYSKLFGAVPGNFADAVRDINWNSTAGMEANCLAAALHLVCQVREEDYALAEIRKEDDGQYRISVAVAAVARRAGFCVRLTGAICSAGFRLAGMTMREVVHGGEPGDFLHKAVCVTSFLATPSVPEAAADAKLEELRNTLADLSWSPDGDIFERELPKHGRFTLAELNVLRAASEFVRYQLSFVDRDAYTLPEIQRFMATYPGIMRGIADAFESKFLPGASGGDFAAALDKVHAEIKTINSGVAGKDAKVKVVLGSVADFVANILKTNCFTAHKAALSFGVDPAFMRRYEELSASYVKAFPPERPFGVFYFWRRNTSGFQIRFSDIARGGWRTVVPRSMKNPLESADLFEQARSETFRECFVLANTQHKKNKDIYEGGSKLVTLLQLDGVRDFKTELWAAQRPVFEAFLQLINYDKNGKLKDAAIVDYTNRMDIIEIGPDENMFDEMICWMGDRAEKAGYTLGSGLISGKPDTGINHKHYGVTSFGVFQYFLRTLQYLNIDPAGDFSVKLSGGPFGDVAGNMIKLLNGKTDGKYSLPRLRIIAVTDGPAAVYDPAGIDREELSRLVHTANLDGFDPHKLRGEGAFMIFNRPDEESRYPMAAVKNGKFIEEKIPRSEFMRLFQNNICHEADIFIPCGGRPQTINIANYADYAPAGKPSSRAIVEGANSFITPDARLALQKLGVVIVRDASANKCGVITSSYEIMSGLLLDKSEFAAIHEKLVAEIMDRLAFCARTEAEWLFHEFALRKNTPMTELSDALANRINAYKAEIFVMLNTHPELVTDGIIFAHLPPLFKAKFADRLERIPAAYRKAIVAAETAQRIVFRKSLSLEEEVRNIAAVLGK